MFRLSLQILSETFLILKKNERDIIRYIYIGLNIKYPLFLSGCNESCIFLTSFRKILKYQISWQSFQWERTDGRTDGQTDRHNEANGRFLQFCNGAFDECSDWKISSLQSFHKSALTCSTRTTKLSTKKVYNLLF